MKYEFLYKPAFYAHVISAICIFTAVMIFLVNYRKVIKLEVPQLIQIFSLLAISMAAHSESHILMETHYGYDPISYLQ